MDFPMNGFFVEKIRFSWWFMAQRNCRPLAYSARAVISSRNQSDRASIRHARTNARTHAHSPKELLEVCVPASMREVPILFSGETTDHQVIHLHREEYNSQTVSHAHWQEEA